MLGGLWTLISDPERFIIDHWPSLLVIVFLITLPFFFKEYIALLRVRAVQIMLAVLVTVMVVWSVRGRWDNDQFQKERDGFQATLDKIDHDNLVAQNEAQKKVEIDAEINRKTLADAIREAANKAGQEKGRADTLQAAIDHMPDQDEVVQPTKDCPKPPPRKPDPVLLQILRGR